MNRFLGPYSDLIYAVMRAVLAFLFWCHGAGKIFGAFGIQTHALVSLLGIAGQIEVIGGILIAVGLFTTCVAFVCSGEMAFAYFMDHAPRGIWPIKNGGELPVALCFAFLYIASRGGGKWSLDALLSRSSKPAGSL